MPPSVKAIFSSGKRTGTPVSSMLVALATIASEWAITCTEKSVWKRFRLKGNTGLTATTECNTTGSPHSWAASNTGS